MATTWNGEALLKKAQAEAAKRLLAAAVFFQTRHRLRLNVSNPRPYKDSSKPGEYPRARTGFGRDNTAYEPADVQGVIAAGLKVRVGYRQNAWYMGYLETEKQRLGLLRTWDDLRPAILKMLGVKAS